MAGNTMRRTLVACAAGLFLNAAAADFATTVLDATFKLFHPESTATCFLVRRPAPDAALYLVTAGHALERIQGDTAVVVLRQPQEGGSYARLDFTVPIRRGGEPLWVRHAQQDVAVLRLAEAPPVPVAALPAAVLADARAMQAAGVHICSPLFVFTFPQRLEADVAGFPVARSGIVASPLLPLPTHPTFLAEFSTSAGDSGGPVFTPGSDGQPLVLGVVVAQFHYDEQVKTEYEDRNIRHPLGLGTVLHAQFVLETLELAAAAVPK